MVAMYAPCQQTRIQDIRPGSVFVYERQDAKYYAIAIASQPEKKVQDFVIIVPGHPQVPGRPAIQDGNTLSGISLAVFPEARILPDLSMMKVGCRQYDPPTGGLFIVNGEPHVRAMAGNYNTLFLNIGTGTQSQDDEVLNSIWFTRWSIVVPNIDGSWYVLCNYVLPE